MKIDVTEKKDIRRENIARAKALEVSLVFRLKSRLPFVAVLRHSSPSPRG